MSMIHKIVIPRHLSSLSYSKWPSGPAWSHLSKYSRCIISRHLLHNKRDERDSFGGIMFIRTYRDPIVIRSVNQDSPIVLPSNLISSAIHLFNLRSSISLLFSYFHAFWQSEHFCRVGKAYAPMAMHNLIDNTSHLTRASRFLYNQLYLLMPDRQKMKSRLLTLPGYTNSFWILTNTVCFELFENVDKIS